jgi:hypothetical protein
MSGPTPGILSGLDDDAVINRPAGDEWRRKRLGLPGSMIRCSRSLEQVTLVYLNGVSDAQVRQSQRELSIDKPAQTPG